MMKEEDIDLIGSEDHEWKWVETFHSFTSFFIYCFLKTIFYLDFEGL